jgi:PKD repeat protein
MVDLDLKKYMLFLALMFASIFTICGSSAATSPVTSFTCNVNYGIAPLSVQFNDISTGNIN